MNTSRCKLNQLAMNGIHSSALCSNTDLDDETENSEIEKETPKNCKLHTDPLVQEDAKLLVITLLCTTRTSCDSVKVINGFLSFKVLAFFLHFLSRWRSRSANSIPQMENLDHESCSDMGDTAVTIEYLRARLLSERSVSKSARERADGLADRVAELEDQLKAVYLQRKKTEKATSDVLAILGGLGITDDSEGCDLSSDQDLTHPKACNGNFFETDTDKSRTMDQLGQEPTTLSCKSLSWKSSRCSSNCERKFSSFPSRRRCSFTSTDYSSPKHRVGKSCRQIKCREMRSTVDEFSKSEAKLDFQVVDDDSKSSRRNHESQDEKLSAGDKESIRIRSPRKLIHSDHHFHIDQEMKRALERQAKLIYSHEAEENAQLEWEEKYNEHNSSTPESIEPGNQSDLTEEQDELKRQPAYFQPVNEVAYSGVKDASTNEVCRILSHENDVGPSSPTNAGPKKYQNVDTELYSHICHPEIAVPLNEMKQLQDVPEGCSCYPPPAATHESVVSNHLSSSQATAATKSNDFEGETSITTRKSIPVSLRASKDLGSVLEALQQAKVSLKHKLKESARQVPGVRVKAVEPNYVPAMSSVEAQMPASCGSLFRVTTNPQAEDNVHKTFLYSRSPSRLIDSFHNSTSTMPLNDQIKLRPREGATMSNMSHGTSFDFSPNPQTALLSLGNGDDCARSPDLCEKGFSNSDRYEFSPQIGTPRSSFTGSDGHAQIHFPDFHFRFLTNDFDSSSSQLTSNKSSIYGGDLHAQGLYENRSSHSSTDRREFKLQDSSTATNLYNSSRLNMFSPTQKFGSTSSGSAQPFSAEPHLNPETDISLSSLARHQYVPALTSDPKYRPATATFPSFPPSAGVHDLTS